MISLLILPAVGLLTWWLIKLRRRRALIVPPTVTAARTASPYRTAGKRPARGF